MSLAFKDFTPRQMAPGRSVGASQWESLASVVERANQWLAAGGMQVVNVETLLLPAAKTIPPNSTAGGVVERWDEDHAWVQVVRVWHEILIAAPPASAPPSV